MENLNKFPLYKLTKSLCLLLAAMCISFNALAQTEVTVDGIKYSLEEEKATVSGLADESITKLNIPETITVDSKNYQVIAIGSRAFSSCSRLTSVDIPNSVSSIGGWAFWGCSGLTSVFIPNSVNELGESPFRKCTNLESFSGKYASEDHRCLIKEGTLYSFAPANLTEYSIPNSVTIIGSSAFEDYSGLASVDIPNSVTSIGHGAFWGCSGLTSVYIPNSVTAIDGAAFGECYNLESFSGKYASEDHRCLIIEGTLNSFAPANLTEYSIPNSVTSIGSDAFSGCSGLASVDIPNSVTSIESWAFAYCKGLASVDIPNSVTSIGNFAFYFCSGLASVIIPGSVTSIGYGTFWGCSDLTSVDIPNSVTAIGNYAFAYCDGITSVTVDNPDPANIGLGWGVFYDVPTNECTLYVPKGSVELYKTAMVWKEFGAIEEIETDGISSAATGIALRSAGNGFAAIGTAAGERVEVYGFDGRLIYSGVTAEGETFIPVSEKACILRIGSKAIKFAK